MIQSEGLISNFDLRIQSDLSTSDPDYWTNPARQLGLWLVFILIKG